MADKLILIVIPEEEGPRLENKRDHPVVKAGTSQTTAGNWSLNILKGTRYLSIGVLALANI